MILPLIPKRVHHSFMNGETQKYDVAIIGAGFCGTLVAVNLALSGIPLRVALIERNRVHGRGLAYGTGDYKHLLNVRADQMGAFPWDIGHFYRWVTANAASLTSANLGQPDPGAYMPRRLYGEYIQTLLKESLRQNPRMELLHDQVVRIIPNAGGFYFITGKNGLEAAAKSVVLAPGNFPPAAQAQTAPWYKNDAYSPEVLRELAEPGDVLIIGSGLTSLDVLATLEHTKKDGHIHVLSRRGLFPQVHQKHAASAPFLDASHLPTTTRDLVRQVREQIRQAEERGMDWRPVIDSMRPFHSLIWGNLPRNEQRRFLRHVQGLWDTHRHRCAPEIMQVKNRLEQEGRLTCHQGRIQKLNPESETVEIIYQPRRSMQPRKFRVARILNCTGPQSNYQKLGDPLIRQLLADDLLAPDPLNMGVCTDHLGTVQNGRGHAIPRLYTLGSNRRGGLYESIAVPELRVQAAEVARQILSHH